MRNTLTAAALAATLAVGANATEWPGPLITAAEQAGRACKSADDPALHQTEILNAVAALKEMEHRSERMRKAMEGDVARCMSRGKEIPVGFDADLYLFTEGESAAAKLAADKAARQAVLNIAAQQVVARELLQQYTIDACTNLAGRDPHAAVLDPICASVFQQAPTLFADTVNASN